MDSETARIVKLFGGHVRRLRRDRGWSQTDLADKIGLSLDMIGRIERGTSTASFDTIVKIALRLDVPVAALFGGSVPRAKAGDRTKRIDSIVAELNGLSTRDLERVHKIFRAATK